MYQLEFLPIAKQDMDEIAIYIAQKLRNFTAAKKLVNEIINATERLIDFPYMYSVYRTIRAVENEHRKLIVKNYIVFYSVNEEDKKIVITRVIYARHNFEKITIS